MIGDVRKFRFWCQKVLPLVYDNSLSYYEVLCKVVQYLNRVIEDVNKIPEYIDAVITERISDEHLMELIEQFTAKIEEAISANNEGSNTNSMHDYAIGTMFWWNGSLYRAIRHIDAGDTLIIGTNVEEIHLDNIINTFVDNIKRSVSAHDDGYNTNATFNLSEGEWVWLNDRLYIAKANITEGTAYVFTGDNANVEELTIEEALNDAIASIQSALVLLDGKINDNTTAINNNTSAINGNTTAINGLVTEVDGVKGTIGTLSNLHTTDKSSVVNAINETYDYATITLENKITNLNNKIDAVEAGEFKCYDNNAQMIADDALEVGDYVMTAGYTNVGDNGNCKYAIVDSNDFDDIALHNGLYAHRIVDYIRAEQFGCVCDGVTDDYAGFSKACAYSAHYRLPLMIYGIIAIAGTINLTNWLTIKGAHDGATLIELNETDLFYANSTLYFVTIESLRLRGHNNKGSAINFDNPANESNVNPNSSTFKNLDVEYFNFGFKVGLHWLTVILEDLAIHDCNHGVYWAGHDGAMFNFKIWDCNGNYGAIYVIGASNRFINGKVWLCINAGAQAAIFVGGDAGRRNMFNDIEIQDCGHCGMKISAKGTVATNISCSENNHENVANACGLAINTTHCIVEVACSNLGRGTEQKYGLNVGGSNNTIIASIFDQITGNYTGSMSNSTFIVNGVAVS